MSTRTLCACVLAAWLAPLASAQTATLPDDESGIALAVHTEDKPALPGLLTKVGALWREPVGEVLPAADPPPPLRPTRFWINNEVLMWWIEGMAVPNLVTTSPAGTSAGVAGVIGEPATTTVFPKGTVDNNMRFGGRSTIGAWLDDEARIGLEVQFLLLASGGKEFGAASDGTAAGPILVRPVTNGVTNGQAAEPIAIPGVSSGAIHITTSTSLIGAGFWFRERFCSSDDPCSTCRPCANGGCSSNGCASDWGSAWRCRFDSMFGYRYLRLGDHLAINDSITAQVALNGLPAGSQLQRIDRFDSDNTFHGVDLGITGVVERGPWSLGVVTKIAVGANDSSVDILGARSVGGAVTGSGLLAQSATNGGHFVRVQASAVPEIDLKFGYILRPNLRLYADYTLLYWFNVLRAGNQVDVNVDPSFLLQGAATGGTPARPALSLQQRDIWVQGISVGLVWSY